MTDKQYAERDAMALDEAGGHYFRHVMAMTAEKLHLKGDIAAELGYRDMQIAALQEQVQKLDNLIADRDKRIAELENSEKTLIRAYTNSSNVLDKHLNNAETAESEIKRRDAAAGEPVGIVSSNSWVDEDSRGEHFWVEWASNRFPEKGTKLYTAAQPSALPPKALGCKAIKLPEPYDDGHGNEWLPRGATIQTLKSQGFTVEGE